MEHPLTQALTRIGDFFAGLCWRSLLGVYFLLLASIIWFIKSSYLPALWLDPVFGLYSLCVTVYLLSRFSLSLLYHPVRRGPDELPTVAVVIPAMNEQAAIETTLTSIFALDYPQHLLSVFAVDDGSTDATWERMAFAARRFPNLHAIRFSHNRGKRAAMAAGIRATEAEIIAFVDSDSVLEPDALRILVQGFADQTVGAICGHADVLNLNDSWMTRMQAVRYYVAFKVCKAAESVFDAVTCCSGCFSAYRREAILPHLDWWEKQMFLGVESTFGDDRSLTNCVLRDWKVRYEEKAVSHTIVPETFQQFMKQQTRWKRSWTRESLIVATFIWKKNPIAAIATYISVVLPLVAPIAALRAMVVEPIMHGSGAPVVYLLGIYAIALVYGLYFAFRQRRYDTLWLSGILFVFFYLAFLLWQTYYAILTSRTRSWGTRAAQPAEAAS